MHLQDITDDGDVSKTGSDLLAWSSISATVNVVAFNSSTTQNGITWSYTDPDDNKGGPTSSWGSSSDPFDSLSSEYKDFLKSGIYRQDDSVLSGLTVGNLYEVQYWVNDSRGDSNDASGKSLTLDSQVALDYNVPDSEGGLGQFAVGTFTADSTSQTIVVSAVDGGADEQINGIQLRAIPEPATLGLLGICRLAIAWYRRKFVR